MREDDHKHKKVINGYTVEAEVSVGTKRMIFGISEDRTKQYPYMKCIATENELFESYDNAVVCDNYAEALRLFADDIKAEAVILETEQRALGDAGEYCYNSEEVRPVYFCDSVKGKVVAIGESELSHGYKDRAHQLFYVTGGFGAEPNSRGNACYCYNLYSGEKDRIERYQIIGYLEEKELPAFAANGLRDIKNKEKEMEGR